ncbi:oxaloacetate decarboxylase, gamma chain [Clostridium sp. AM29-11AC]|uniref:OadG family protein n=1 Tax=Clostridium sp. AM29-11AC TaxID=2293028 RepID=UPI000E4C54E5|nr:OadG family protein [Clostridium sp. AM29-11AC]RHT56932.1 oxaloacetate decarboxylase, gamma chain [Clostridium sp. AM29-11AC]
MKQNIKRLLLVLCTITCFFVLSGCTKSEETSSAELTDEIRETLVNGAGQYLSTFAGYSDEELDEQIKRAEKTDNTVIATALSSWKSVKEDLGSLEVDETGAPLIRADEARGEKALEVTAADEDTYEIDMTVVYEKRDMNFVLTAEAQEDQYGGSVLTVTEMTFTPEFTIGEKLEKAFLNMIMGMGTVFIVLIFISFIIGRLKIVNDWEKKRKEKAAEKTAAPAPAPVPAPAPAPAVAPASAPAPAPAPAPAAAPASIKAVAVPVQAKAPDVSAPAASQENLADDLELVAVITAAISAAQNVPVEGLVVRSIRRKSGSNWKRA